MLPDPVYVLKIEDAPWDVWKNIRFSRSIERMGGEFQVGLTTNPNIQFIEETFIPGLACSVEVDGQTVLDGWIDVLNHQYDAQNANIDITGRDKTGDLIDCAATIDGPFEFKNQKLEKIIERVLKPYKIPLKSEVDTGPAFGRLAIQPGETAYEFIERACRYRAVLPVSDGIGGMVLVKPGQERSPGMLVYGQNILSGQISMDYTGRFSEYILKGQQEGDDDSSSDEVSAVEGRAKDELVKRYRPKVIVGEAQGYSQTLSQRAAWEKKVARGRSNRATYTAQGWYADPSNKTLWRPNTIVKVTDPARALNRDMLIVSTSFTRGADGTKTTLDLALPEAFELQAEKQPETKDVWGDA